MGRWIFVRDLAWVMAFLVASPAVPSANMPGTTQLSRFTAGNADHSLTRVLEIRSYNLKPGTRDRFHQRFVRESLPLLQRFKVDVVAYGPSLHDADTYFLMRSYASLQDRQRSEDEFYGSDAWKKGPREAVMADIDSYTTVVLQKDEATINALRAGPH